jgi:cell wall-associated NlpC family hydrolase
MFPDWVEKYIGIPFLDEGRDPAVGMNCWSLFQHVCNVEGGMSVPDYNGPLWYGRTKSDPRGITAAMYDYAEQFVPVEPGDERMFDGILLRVGGFPTHCGVIIEPGYMLHVEVGSDSVIEAYRESMMWRTRVAGFYRYIGGEQDGHRREFDPPGG